MIELPQTYEEARPRLALVLRRRFTPVHLVRAARRGPAWFSVVGASFGWLEARLILETDVAIHYVQQRHLSLWGVRAETALADARRDYEASAGILSLRSGFAAVPCRDVLLHGDDPPSLLEEARARYDEADERLSPLVFRIRWPADNPRTAPVSQPRITPIGPVPHSEGQRAIRLAELLALLQAYDDQADALLEELDEGVVLPGLNIGERGGELVSVANWSGTEPACLPRVDWVRVGGALVPFASLELEPLPGLDPPRFLAIPHPRQ